MINFRMTKHSRTVARIADLPSDGLPEIVFAGRSNVGKSSLINLLCGQKNLARVSQVPGKTRQLIYFNVNDELYFVDLPGYGFARSPAQQTQDFSKLTDSYLTSDRPIKLVLHLLDVRHEPSELDVQMINWLASREQPFHIILTKADQVKRQAALARMRSIEKQFRDAGYEADDRPTVLLTSTLKRQGHVELRRLIAASVGKQAAAGD